MGKYDEPLFVERRDDGKYKVERANASRASGVFDTQKGAIDWASDHTRRAPYMWSV